ncbi:unnamed protein product [Citrullus colocynthis]|uniref:Uncharacterized protein n=1 Tax=Citrullus colocynthis TaxID=252529 RepID=A0ABP0YRV5_9ROSI
MLTDAVACSFIVLVLSVIHEWLRRRYQTEFCIFTDATRQCLLIIVKATIILTHEHADAILGLDDIRVVQPFSATNEINLTPVYLAQDMNMTESVAMRLPYLVQKELREGQEVRRVSQLDYRITEDNYEEPFTASGLQFVPFPAKDLRVVPFEKDSSKTSDKLLLKQ